VRFDRLSIIRRLGGDQIRLLLSAADLLYVQRDAGQFEPGGSHDRLHVDRRLFMEGNRPRTVRNEGTTAVARV
jgi:hypothetical protein